MIIYLSLLISLIGLFLYLAMDPTNPKASVVGLHMFWVGLLAFLINYTHVVNFVR